MSDTGNDESRDKQGRFLKDRPSGNPRGRTPNKAKGTNLTGILDPNAALILRLNRKTMRHIQNGEVTEITRLESAYEQLYMLGMKNGDVAALKLYIGLANAAHEIEKEHRMQALQAAVEYKDYWLPFFDQAERLGRPVPRQLPHPRDVVINEDGSTSILGPVDIEGQQILLQVVEMRDACISMILDLRERDSLNEILSRLLRSCQRKLREFNKVLPPRLKRPLPSS